MLICLGKIFQINIIFAPFLKDTPIIVSAWRPANSMEGLESKLFTQQRAGPSGWGCRRDPPPPKRRCIHPAGPRHSLSLAIPSPSAKGLRTFGFWLFTDSPGSSHPAVRTDSFEKSPNCHRIIFSKGTGLLLLNSTVNFDREKGLRRKEFLMSRYQNSWLPDGWRSQVKSIQVAALEGSSLEKPRTSPWRSLTGHEKVALLASRSERLS